MEKDTQIFGLRAVIEAVNAGETVDKVFLQKGKRVVPIYVEQREEFAEYVQIRRRKVFYCFQNGLHGLSGNPLRHVGRAPGAAGLQYEGQLLHLDVLRG